MCWQGQQRIQSRFMLASCLDGHTTPSHEKGNRVPSAPPSTGQRPPIPAMAPSSTARPCSGYTYEHNTEKALAKKHVGSKERLESRERSGKQSKEATATTAAVQKVAARTRTYVERTQTKRRHGCAALVRTAVALFYFYFFGRFYV